MFLNSLRVLTFIATVCLAAMPATAQTADAESDKPIPVGLARNNEEKTALELLNLKDQIKRCTRLEDLSSRLICYDNLAMDLGYVTAGRKKADAETIGKIGFWQISTKNNADGIKQTYLRIQSTNLIESRSGTERQVAFVISCVPGKTEAFLDWKAPVVDGLSAKSASKVLVSYYTNSDEKITGDWEISTDKYALFSLDPVPFVRGLLNKKKLTVQFVAQGSNVESIQFDITGVETAVDTIVKSCY